MERVSIFDAEKLEEFRKEHKLQPFRLKQIFHEIFKNAVIDFSEMTTLSKELREQLAAYFFIIPFTVDQVQENEETTKFLFKLNNGNVIETVIMFHYQDVVEGSTDYKMGFTSHIDGKRLNRLTLCVSSQVGCPVGCIFCVTGKLGFYKNVDRTDILGQVLYANNYLKNKLGKRDDGILHSIRNIVFMGMGEPLLNYENVKKSLEFILDQGALSLSRRHVTISTSGIIPGINKMLEDNLGVMLAVSLHAPNQELRHQLIPTITKQYTLDLLMSTLDEFTRKTGQRIFYEYIMIKGKTDSPELAKELAVLLRNRNAHLNLIPYNQNPAIDLEESSRNAIFRFKDVLEQGGITVTVRDTLGRGVQGACGQLGYEKVNEFKEKIKESGKNLKVLGE